MKRPELTLDIKLIWPRPLKTCTFQVEIDDLPTSTLAQMIFQEVINFKNKAIQHTDLSYFQFVVLYIYSIKPYCSIKNHLRRKRSILMRKIKKRKYSLPIHIFIVRFYETSCTALHL